MFDKVVLQVFKQRCCRVSVKDYNIRPVSTFFPRTFSVGNVNDNIFAVNFSYFAVNFFKLLVNTGIHPVVIRFVLNKVSVKSRMITKVFNKLDCILIVLICTESTTTAVQTNHCHHTVVVPCIVKPFFCTFTPCRADACTLCFIFIVTAAEKVYTKLFNHFKVFVKNMISKYRIENFSVSVYTLTVSCKCSRSVKTVHIIGFSLENVTVTINI